MPEHSNMSGSILLVVYLPYVGIQLPWSDSKLITVCFLWYYADNAEESDEVQLRQALMAYKVATAFRIAEAVSVSDSYRDHGCLAGPC